MKDETHISLCVASGLGSHRIDTCHDLKWGISCSLVDVHVLLGFTVRLQDLLPTIIYISLGQAQKNNSWNNDKPPHEQLKSRRSQP